MTNGELIKKTVNESPLDLLLTMNLGIQRHGGSADCALGAFAGVTECAVRCGEHASCADCLKHWLDEEEDGWS